MSLAWSASLDVLDVHCGGEIGKVVLPGVIDIPGASLLDKMHHLNTVDDSIRRFLALEPRGAVHMSVNLLLPPVHPEADAAFIVLQADRAHPMSGSNCICVATALLEAGLVQSREPETRLTLETPAGLIRVRAECIDGRCVSVSLDNVPAFADQLDRTLQTDRWGPIVVDIAFGGVFYAIVDVKQLGLTIAPQDAQRLVEAGLMLNQAVNKQVEVAHPELPGIDRIAYVMFRDSEADGAVRTCTTLRPGRADRSPCGTGSSANLATQHARGQVAVGETKVSRSIVGSEFAVQLVAETSVAGRLAILPRISGQAWVYGHQRVRLDPRDPFPLGFALSDATV